MNVANAALASSLVLNVQAMLTILPLFWNMYSRAPSTAGTVSVAVGKALTI